jgi:hypothetical protein
VENSLAEYPDMTEEDLTALLDSTRLSTVDKRKFKEEWLGNSVPDFEKMSAIHREATALTKDSPMEERWQMQRRIATEVHPDYRAGFRQILGASTADHSADGLAAKRTLANSLLTERFDELAEKMGLDFDGGQEAVAKFETARALNTWLDTNPEASPAEINDWLTTNGLSKPPKSKAQQIEQDDDELAPVGNEKGWRRYLFGL